MEYIPPQIKLRFSLHVLYEDTKPIYIFPSILMKWNMTSSQIVAILMAI